MKDGLTKDGKLVKYEKNEEKSIIGQYVVYNVYDEKDTLLGQRIGVRDFKSLDYAELFGADGKLKFDMRPTKEDKPPKSKNKVETRTSNTAKKEVDVESKDNLPEKELEEKQEPDEDVKDNTTTKIESVERAHSKRAPFETHTSLGEGEFQSDIRLRVSIRGKRKVTGSDIIEYLQKKYTIYGYDTDATIKAKKEKKADDKKSE